MRGQEKGCGLRPIEHLFSVLNMSSVDLTAAARIRNAALALFGEQGYDATTIRQIAQRAGVSLGLVNHHFGSKEGLRDACNEWIMAFIASEKGLVAAGGSLPELGRYLSEHPEFGPILGYLTRELAAGGPVADHLFDELVRVTREVCDAGIASGTIRPTTDEPARAALLVAYSIGALLAAAPLARHLGGTDLLEPDVYRRYTASSFELFTHGMLTPSFPALPEEDA